MSENYTRSFFYIGVILILSLVPVSQIIPINFIQPQTASATSGIVLNGTKTTSATVVVPILNVTLSNFNVGTGNDRVLIVGVESSDAGVSSITFGGTSLTKAVSHFTNSDTEFWYLANPSGTHNIVVTMNAPTKLVIGAYSFFGASQTNPIPTHATSYANSTGSPTISITTANANSWVLDSAAIYGGVTLGSPTCTQRWDINVGGLEPPHKITGASSSTIKASAGSVTCSWTATPGELWDDVAIEVKASTAPGAPTSPTSTTISTTQLKLSWTTPSDNGGSSITGYKIQRAGTSWVDVVNNTGSTLANYNVTSLAANSVYKFHIAAWNDVGLGTYSSNVTGTTLPNSPTGLTATTISSSQINLSWTAPTGGNGTLNGYKIESSTNGGSTWSTVVANTTNTGTTYSNTGLASGTTYTYRVSALNSGGASSPSSTTSATTSGTPSSWHSSTGILVPLYCDPYNYTDQNSTCTSSTSFKWQNVNDTKTTYPHVPLFVILNPENGPGENPVPNCATDYSSFQNRTRDFNNGIGNLTKAGAVVLGYVYTSSGSRPLTGTGSVENDINSWHSCYPKIKGIFLDEMPNNVNNHESYYTAITNYVHSHGLTYSFGNPGADTYEGYNGTVDNLDIWETFAMPSILDLQGQYYEKNWHEYLDKSKFSLLVWNQTSLTGPATIGNDSNYAGFMYVTNNPGCGKTYPCSDSAANPWNTTSTYLSQLALDLSHSTEIITINSVNSGGTTLTGFYVNVTQSGNWIPSGNTTLNYNATSGVKYTFTPATSESTHNNCLFDHWQDTNSQIRSRSILVNSSSATFTAVYKDNAGTCQ